MEVPFFARSGLQAVALAGLAVACVACGDDQVTGVPAAFEIVPLPSEGQSVLAQAEPVGLSLGTIPLFSVHEARFRVTNIGSARLAFDGAAVESVDGGAITVSALPVELVPQESGLLVLGVEAFGDAAPVAGVVRIDTNADVNRGEGRVEVRGIGEFVGAPTLQLVYDGVAHVIPDECVIEGGVCTMPMLSFGSVSFSTTAAQQLIIRNQPLTPAACQVPAGLDACTPVCAVTFSGESLSFDPSDVGFTLVGSTALPFRVAPATNNPDCQGGGVVRGDLRLLLSLQTGPQQEDLASNLVLDTNLPAAPRVLVPVRAAVREGPVAVAAVRACSLDDPPPNCSDPENLTPLSFVHLTGLDSYDPRDPSNPSLIVAHEWTMLEAPPGVTPQAFVQEGPGLAAVFLPSAGRYVVRLQVTNDLNAKSGVGPTSDLELVAAPSSRIHVQLTWNNALNDLDLHLVNASLGDLPYHREYDCFSFNCKPAPSDPPSPSWPVQWFFDDGQGNITPPHTGPNPRLDLDDANGLGPENINIDDPLPGRYRIYVHYYGLVPGTDITPTEATVRVFVDGVAQPPLVRVLGVDDLWRVAEIHWRADDSAVVSIASPDEEGQVGAVQSLPFLPGPGGFEFGTQF